MNALTQKHLNVFMAHRRPGWLYQHAAGCWGLPGSGYGLTAEEVRAEAEAELDDWHAGIAEKPAWLTAAEQSIARHAAARASGAQQAYDAAFAAWTRLDALSTAAAAELAEHPDDAAFAQAARSAKRAASAGLSAAAYAAEVLAEYAA